ncbi:MAG: HAD-IIA family hydrolase [Trueperaceae bacterium]|nr:HAD-IIA family hydrolase [Trueperaceae bacterium]
MNFKAMVIDMDGVLWHGDTPLPGLKTFFDYLEAKSLPFILATNNAMKIAADYTQKLAGFGVKVAPEHILTSSEAAASYIKHSFPDEPSIYVMGESGLHRAIKAQGFEILSPEEVKAGAKARIVVGGLMRQALNYDVLAMGSLLVQGGASFIATNYDSSFPSELGLLPGAGAVLSVVERSSGVSPTVIGKPNTIMFEEALRRLGTAAADTVMLGDRLNTDIEGGKKVGMQTILVLSGVSSLEDVERSSLKPDYTFQDIAALSKALA